MPRSRLDENDRNSISLSPSFSYPHAHKRTRLYRLSVARSELGRSGANRSTGPHTRFTRASTSRTLGRVIRAQWGYSLGRRGIHRVTVSRSRVNLVYEKDWWRATGVRRTRAREKRSDKTEGLDRDRSESACISCDSFVWNPNNSEGKRYIRDTNTLFRLTFEIFADFLPFYLRRMLLNTMRDQKRANKRPAENRDEFVPPSRNFRCLAPGGVSIFS